MNKYIKAAAFTAVCIGAAGILWVQSHPETISKQSILSTSDSKNNVPVTPISIPDTYQKTYNDTFSIDAKIVVPESFDSDSFYQSNAHLISFDQNAFKSYFLDSSQSCTEETYDESTQNNEVFKCTMYTQEDLSTLYASDFSMIYYTNSDKFDSELYICDFSTGNATYNGDLFSTTSDLSFMNRESALENIFDILKNKLNFNTDLLKVKNYYSLDHKTLQEEEQKRFKRGEIDNDELKDSWSDKDDTYYLQFHQETQNLPVYSSQNVGDGYDTETHFAQNNLRYDENGIESLSLEYLYEFDNSNNPIQFAPFETVIDTIAEKYTSVISNSSLTANECRLYACPIFIDDNTYNVIPVWIWQVINEESDAPIYIPVNAITGEELLEME